MPGADPELGARAKLLIFDSHPVQYKAPVYQELQRQRPGAFQVIYASDCSVRGYADADFAGRIAWDVPLLAGYPSEILGNERGTPLQGFRSLTGRGVFARLRRRRPRAVLLSQFLYEFDLVTYLSCLLLRIPIWIRHETQDEAFRRSPRKSLLRALYYRLVYAGVSHAFFIGQLSREHLRRHGVSERRLSFAPYCTPERPAPASLRAEIRARFGVAEGETLVLFSGKLIEKKDPGLLLEMLAALRPAERAQVKVLYVGSGRLEEALRAQAADFPGQVHFAGFINQTEMPGYYGAAEVLVLPSRRMGETWGLVVNEALQAGCAVVVSEAAGSHREFAGWERVRVIPEGDAAAAARALAELMALPPDRGWCADRMKAYSVPAAAAALAAQLDTLPAT